MRTFGIWALGAALGVASVIFFDAVEERRAARLGFFVLKGVVYRAVPAVACQP